MGHSLQVEHTFHSERDSAPVHHNIVHSHHKGRERKKQSQQDADTNTCTRDSQQLFIVMTNSVTVVVVVVVVVFVSAFNEMSMSTTSEDELASPKLALNSGMTRRSAKKKTTLHRHQTRLKAPCLCILEGPRTLAMN